MAGDYSFIELGKGLHMQPYPIIILFRHHNVNKTTHTYQCAVIRDIFASDHIQFNYSYSFHIFEISEPYR